MRFILLFAGFMVAIFMMPIFMLLWNDWLLPMSERVTNPHTLLFYQIAPYAIVAVIVISAFLTVRGRTER